MCAATTSTAGLRRRSECRTPTSTVVIGPRTSADHPRSALVLCGRVLPGVLPDPSLRTTQGRSVEARRRRVRARHVVVEPEEHLVLVVAGTRQPAGAGAGDPLLDLGTGGPRQAGGSRRFVGWVRVGNAPPPPAAADRDRRVGVDHHQARDDLARGSELAGHLVRDHPAVRIAPECVRAVRLQPTHGCDVAARGRCH